MPHVKFPEEGESLFASAMTPGILLRVAGGPALVSKNLPSFCFVSSVVGGYHEMSAGSPSKKSGMKTRYFWSLLAVERISAPWMVCGKKPKMSISFRILSLHLTIKDG
jgi:hypothetical protein